MRREIASAEQGAQTRQSARGADVQRTIDSEPQGVKKRWRDSRRGYRSLAHNAQFAVFSFLPAARAVRLADGVLFSSLLLRQLYIRKNSTGLELPE